MRIPPQFLDAPDGVRLAYRVLGEGRPLLALHGFFSTGAAGWIASGHADVLVERGHQLIVPDLRAHGRSGRPSEASAYPPDVLVDDALALLRYLQVDDYDVAGYSLGARTVVRMLVRGAAPVRAVVAGQGLAPMTRPAGTVQGTYFRRVLTGQGPFEASSPEAVAEQWLRRIGGDPAALLAVLDSSVGTPLEQLTAITTPVLVAMGAEDDPRGGRDLADVLPDARYVQVPGDHVAAASRPELAAAIADFLV